MPSVKEPVRELGYDEYQSRQFEEISLMQIEKRTELLNIGNRASWNGRSWKPTPYPGFAMQAMLSERFDKTAISMELQDMQKKLVESVQQPGTLYPLPAASFHQTVANTFSANRLEENLASKGLVESFPKIIEECLESWSPNENQAPPLMRLIGISIFRTAVGILGTFDRARDFQRVLDFRDFFYSHPKLNELGLRRTRPFIGHLTLAYVESELSYEQKQGLVDCISALNERIRKNPIFFEMPCARLHSYSNLSAFNTFPEYPAASL